MSVIRAFHNKENPYVQLNKQALWDPNLSLTAAGLWARCLSKPDDWTFRIPNLVKHFKEGKTAVYSALKELIDNGYCLRIQIRGNKDRWGKETNRQMIQSVEYVMFEFKLTDKEKLDYEKMFLLSGFLEVENEDLENEPILKKEITPKKEPREKEPPPHTPPIEPTPPPPKQAPSAEEEEPSKKQNKQQHDLEQQRKLDLFQRYPQYNLSPSQHRRLLGYTYQQIKTSLETAAYIKPKQGYMALISHILANPFNYQDVHKTTETSAQGLARNHNDLIRSKGYTSIADRNNELISQGFMIVLFQGITTQVALKDDNIKGLMQDLLESERCLK